jgi:hypothetical protein
MKQNLWAFNIASPRETCSWLEPRLLLPQALVDQDADKEDDEYKEKLDAKGASP